MKLDQIIKHKRELVNRADAAATEIGKRMEQHEDAMKDLSGQIEAEKKSGATYRQEMQKVQQTINKLKRQLEEKPADFDIDFYNEKIVSAFTREVYEQELILFHREKRGGR